MYLYFPWTKHGILILCMTKMNCFMLFLAFYQPNRTDIIWVLLPRNLSAVADSQMNLLPRMHEWKVATELVPGADSRIRFKTMWFLCGYPPRRTSCVYVVKKLFYILHFFHNPHSLHTYRTNPLQKDNYFFLVIREAVGVEFFDDVRSLDIYFLWN